MVLVGIHIIIYRIMNEGTNKYNVREIIANVLQAVGMNGPGFAKAIGLPYTVVYNLQSGRTKKFRPAIADPMVKAFPRLNLEYLYTGDGEVLKDEVPSETERVSKFAGSLDNVVELQKKIFDKLDELSKKEKELNEMERRLNLKELELIKRESECQLRESKLGIQKVIV